MCHYVGKKRFNPTKFSHASSTKKLYNFDSSTSSFDLFFDDKVVNFLTEMTTLYPYRDDGKNAFHLDSTEFCLEMLLLFDPNVLPDLPMFWENSEDV